MTPIATLVAALSMATLSACVETLRSVSPDGRLSVTHSDAQWRTLLTPAQYHGLREYGTETPFSSSLVDEHRHGVFSCAACRRDLFLSVAKFDSGTGWPSFWKALDSVVVAVVGRWSGRAPTCVAATAEATSATYSTTDRPPPACATP